MFNNLALLCDNFVGIELSYWRIIIGDEIGVFEREEVYELQNHILSAPHTAYQTPHF